MQAATNANDELRHKLTHHEQEAQDMRQGAHDELQRVKLQASTEQAAADAASHALQATRSQLEGYHAECNSPRPTRRR